MPVWIKLLATIKFILISINLISVIKDALSKYKTLKTIIVLVIIVLSIIPIYMVYKY